MIIMRIVSYISSNFCVFLKIIQALFKEIKKKEYFRAHRIHTYFLFVISAINNNNNRFLLTHKTILSD